MPTVHGRTSREEALTLLREAEADLQAARALVETRRPTREAKCEAFRLLAGVQSKCAVLQIAMDPW